MKNYKKLFNEANKTALEDYKKKKRRYERYTTLFSMMFGIFVSVLVLFIIQYITDDLNYAMEKLKTHWVLFFFLYCIGFIIAKSTGIVKIKPSTTYLESKAKEFASKTYLPDMLSALKRKFVFFSLFESRLTKIIQDHYWFDHDELTFDPSGITLDYTKNEEESLLPSILIKGHESCEYYLTGWDYYPHLPFRFYFDKINPDRQVEEVTFQLSLTI